MRSEAVSQRVRRGRRRARFAKADLPVQPYQPVRNRIIRGKSIWVPAVLRGNAIPNKVLVEMVNLSNKKDAALLAAARDRERLADALLRSLELHFERTERGRRSAGPRPARPAAARPEPGPA